MTLRMDDRRVTDQFAAVDNDGNEHTVFEITGFHERRFPDGSHKEIPVEREYSLADDSPVNVLGDDTFQIAGTGVVMRRVR